jgi:hypothetical protein
LLFCGELSAVINSLSAETLGFRRCDERNNSATSAVFPLFLAAARAAKEFPPGTILERHIYVITAATLLSIK